MLEALGEGFRETLLTRRISRVYFFKCKPLRGRNNHILIFIRQEELPVLIQSETIRHSGYIIADNPFRRELFGSNPVLNLGRQLRRASYVFMEQISQ
jgi:hypothetical protein